MNKGPGSQRPILGIDIGGTKTMAAVATPRGRVRARAYRATPAQEGPEAGVRAILEAVRQALREAGITPAQLRGVGLGIAGASNPETGILSFSPHLPRWRDVPLRDMVAGGLGVRTFLGNDANLAALGELHFGAGRGFKNFVHITLGTGIGGGIIIDGKLYAGACGAAGEVGHMTIDVDGPRCDCGNIGCWEALVSGTALAREAKRRIEEGAKTSILEHAPGGLEEVSAHAVSLAAQQGDPLAQELIARTGYYLGVGLANLVNIFNPQLILIGGGLSHMGDMLLKPAERLVRERAFKVSSEAVQVTWAQLGEDSGVLGAVALVLQETRGLK